MATPNSLTPNVQILKLPGNVWITAGTAGYDDTTITSSNRNARDRDGSWFNIYQHQ